MKNDKQYMSLIDYLTKNGIKGDDPINPEVKKSSKNEYTVKDFVDKLVKRETVNNVLTSLLTLEMDTNDIRWYLMGIYTRIKIDEGDNLN